MVDISLHTSKLSFPRFRNLHLREQLLLQIFLISIIAFSVAFFAVWELHRTKDLLTSVRDSSRPARSAQQLAKEIEHIYGLSEAYQLSFNQPEQRPAIYAVLRRLNGITQKMRALARGETVAVTGAEKSDELGEMARALQVFWKAELERREFQYKLQHANKELQREVDDSIYVAQRIQNALLRGKVPPGPWLSDQALINRPCKLLGGDSYWLERFDDGYVVALIDCTGHGVPGAMMTIATSIYMSAILHQEDLRDPAQILLRLADHVQNSLFEKSDDVKFDAGFDGAVCFVDVKSQRLCYAGGGIPLIVLDSNSGEIGILKGNGFGIDRPTFDSRLVNRAVELRPGLRFYLTSDGLVTQPDAPRGVGFGWTRLVKLLRETHHLSLAEQNERLWTSFREFSADTEQRDDVTVIAFAA